MQKYNLKWTDQIKIINNIIIIVNIIILILIEIVSKN